MSFEDKINIDQKSGEARLTFDTRFYARQAVLAASQAFTEGCWVYTDGNDTTLFVTLKPKRPEEDLLALAKEFFNYTLGCMQNAL